MSEPVDFIEHDPFDPAMLEQFERALKEKQELAPDEAKQMLERRRLAYTRVFTAGERTQEDIDVVLADLAWFCKFTVPTYDIRDGEHALELSKRKEGRREVFNRVFQFARLRLEPLLLMYTDATTK